MKPFRIKAFVILIAFVFTIEFNANAQARQSTRRIVTPSNALQTERQRVQQQAERKQQDPQRERNAAVKREMQRQESAARSRTNSVREDCISRETGYQ